MRILKPQDRNAGRDLTVPCCSAEQSSVNNPQPPEGGREGRFCFCLTRVSCHYNITISKNFVLRTRYNSKSSPERTKPEDLSGVCCRRIGFKPQSGETKTRGTGSVSNYLAVNVNKQQDEEREGQETPA